MPGPSLPAARRPPHAIPFGRAAPGTDRKGLDGRGRQGKGHRVFSDAGYPHPPRFWSAHQPDKNSGCGSHSRTHPLFFYQYCFTVSLDSLSDKWNLSAIRFIVSAKDTSKSLYVSTAPLI